MTHATPDHNNFSLFEAACYDVLTRDDVITDVAKRYAYATDASFYTQTPRLVLRVPDVTAMKRIVALANKHKIALTFRAAGTSLSGQAITDSVLVLLTPDWTGFSIIDNGHAISLQPGIIGAKANHILQPFGRKIGPDPASINACKIGGIAANNASGMCCGVKHNSYHTLRALHIILADGSELDTASEDSISAFSRSHAPLLSTLSTIRASLLANTALAERVRHQYRIKNTMGYGLNALLDYTDPIDILSHLMIGSEGTLGFIANITYNTISLPNARQTGLYQFSNIADACGVISALQQYHVDAVELMDARALQAVAPLLNDITRDGVQPGKVALLIDIGGANVDAVNATVQHVAHTLTHDGNGQPLCDFTHDPVRISKLWDIRKGLFPAVGANRPSGTTVIIEDVAFPLSQLADGIIAIEALFTRFNYDDGIIFGHALDGNVHFVFSQGFNTDSDTARYANFMKAVSDVVTKQFDGSLKAEHGTGRNMAPFLRDQWGDDGVEIMQLIKQAIDPRGILNPGVIINDDVNAHLTHLKPLPAIDPRVDACIECGFCEPQCPSKDYTLTPRQRIALKRREKYNLLSDDSAKQQDADAIAVSYTALALDSCAATGLCATTCPVGIDTGEWVTQLRYQQRTRASRAMSGFAAKHIDDTRHIATFALSAGHHVNQRLGTNTMRKVTASRLMPTWRDFMPKAAPSITRLLRENKVTAAGNTVGSNVNTLPQSDATRVVYLPSCSSHVFGTTGKEKAVSEAMFSLFKKAGITLIVANKNNLCCGKPWESRGEIDIAQRKKREWLDAAEHVEANEHTTAITDNAACVSKASTHSKQVIDVSEYLLTDVLPRLIVTKLDAPLMLHTTCSTTKRGEHHMLYSLAKACSDNVLIPTDISCCGFAGDKGFSEPKLNEYALQPLRAQVPKSVSRGVTNSATCAIGLTEHSGVLYSHIVVLLDELSQPLPG
ncbi:FAD-binding and (Fe-S)-binding domain-containing protein [Alteromonas sp. A079]|uniref:FAD-binding and (Fe-S)-binding domain-containing protein n=1 Tax=Alteromonas sp. A079 TaxID=3410268 RepID=UPI003B9E42DF